ncbi:MAG: cell division protein FtsH, partial [Rhodospirillaceae bacterium]|nr:cell division protein FtsH [Rhodospirillaceae bacterium]
AMHIDEAVKDIVDGLFQRALAILRENRAVLDSCARTLLAKETLMEAEIRALTGGLKRGDSVPVKSAAE